MKAWVKEYEPKKISEIEGQKDSVLKLKEYIVDYKKQKKNGVIIYGPTGCGKTCSVYIIADELDLEVLEVNASDIRNQDSINSIIGSAISQVSLFSKGKIILVDEIDGLSGTKDRGGIAAIIKLLEKTSFPMVMTANNPYEKKLSTLTRKTEVIEFNALDYQDIFRILKKICKKENVDFDETALKTLARRAGGDARAAVNDLQALADENKKITRETIDAVDDRKQTVSVPQALVTVFKSMSADISRRAFDNVNEDTDHIILWIDENLPYEYTKPEDLAKAYNALSRADVFKGRIRRWQHWRFLVYINDLITAGISLAKKEKYKGITNYRQTTRLLKIWQANMKNQKRKSIAAKLAARTHCSSKRALDSVDYYRNIFRKDKNMASSLAKELDLSGDEVSWLQK